MTNMMKIFKKFIVLGFYANKEEKIVLRTQNCSG